LNQSSCKCSHRALHCVVHGGCTPPASIGVIAMGKLVQPTGKVTSTAAVELPEYNSEALTIIHDGETIKAPDGTKFITDDGQTFILRHARTLPGGWRRLRVNKPKTTAAAPAQEPKAAGRR
jgi:hypothetical protein